MAQRFAVSHMQVFGVMTAALIMQTSHALGELTSDEEKQMLPRCRVVASKAQTAVNSSGHKPSACRAFTSPAKSWASSLPGSLQARPCRTEQG